MDLYDPNGRPSPELWRRAIEANAEATKSLNAREFHIGQRVTTGKREWDVLRVEDGYVRLAADDGALRWFPLGSPMLRAIDGPEPGEQCVNKACGEDAAEIILGDALCTEHGAMAREAVAYEASLSA